MTLRRLLCAVVWLSLASISGAGEEEREENQAGAHQNQQLFVLLIGSPEDREWGWRFQGAVESWTDKLQRDDGIVLRLRSTGASEAEILQLADETESLDRVVLIVHPTALVTAPQVVDDARIAYAIERVWGLPFRLVAVERNQPSAGDWPEPAPLVLLDDAASYRVLAQNWFRNAVLTNGVERNERWVDSPVPNGSRAIHAVFFGAARTAVVREVDYRAAVARNSQIGEETGIVGQSEPMLGDVIVVRDRNRTGVYGLAVRVFSKMGRSVEGRRVMSILGWDGLRPAGENVEGVYQEMRTRLRGGRPKDRHRPDSGKLADERGAMSALEGRRSE